PPSAPRDGCRVSSSRVILAIIGRDAPLRRVVSGAVSRDRGHPVDAGLRAAAGVLLEFHPARELSRDWPGMSAGDAAPAADRVVSAGAIRRGPRGGSAPPRGRGAEHV